MLFFFFFFFFQQLATNANGNQVASCKENGIPGEVGCYRDVPLIFESQLRKSHHCDCTQCSVCIEVSVTG